MSPEDVQKLRHDIEEVITLYCERVGIDPHDPYAVNAHKRQIWDALEQSGKLHPDMSFAAFDASISQEAMRSQVRTTFENIFGARF